MSGRPSWAITERSAYSTSEWMMLSRCTTTSIFEAGMSNSHRASTTSRPLFIRVAESMVILSPIFQFGCFSACSTVTSRSCSLVRFQSGPPEAVRMSRRMSFTRCPSMDWKSALCSLSTGKIRTPRLRASSCMRRPAITIGSLFARATNFPAVIAASVGTSPAPPTMAEMTRSASASVAICRSPSVPLRIVVFRPLHRARRRSAAAWSAMATTAGENVRTCSSSLSTLPLAVRPTAWNFSVNLLMMSRVLVPMEPVEPRMTIRFMRCSSGKSHREEAIVEYRCREDQAVHAIQHAAVAGDEPAGILDAGAALQGGFAEIAERRGDADYEAQPGGLTQAQGVQEPGVAGERGHDRSEQPADGSLPGLLWADGWRQGVSPQQGAHVIGGRIVGPRHQEKEENQKRPVGEPVNQDQVAEKPCHIEGPEHDDGGVEKPGFEVAARERVAQENCHDDEGDGRRFGQAAGGCEPD